MIVRFGALYGMASPTTPPKPNRQDYQWDVFLSYRHPDKEAVKQIATTLDALSLKVWWDEWEVPPGADFEQKLWEGLKGSYATAVFIGPQTIGGWQDREVKAAIDQQVRSSKPVMPVFLPGIPDPDQIDLEFLGMNSRVVLESLDQLNRLYWGITGINLDRPRQNRPVEVKPVVTGETQAAEDALAWLAQWTKSGNITFFVGPGAAEGGPTFPPRNWEIARQLLREMKVIETDDIKFLPPIDIATMLFAVSKTDPVLEETVVNLIQSRSSAIPAAHQTLAALLARLGGRERPRGRKFEKQLILTSNIDLMMERALLRAGVRFTRVVQHKSQHSLFVTNYHDAPFIPSQIDQLDDFIISTESKTLSPDMAAGSILAEPILYKLRGSQDIAGSCALTRPQLLAQARAVISEHLIPADLQRIGANSPIVFLGAGLLDTDFQYMSQTVLFNAWDSDHPKYMVQVAPEQDREDGYRQMEATIWEKIKQSAMRRNLATVEEPSTRFLQRLLAAV